MFVCAGITILMMIISLAKKDEYMVKLLIQSRNIPSFSPLEQMKAIYRECFREWSDWCGNISALWYVVA